MSLLTYSYLAVLALLALYGFHRAQLVWLYFRHRRRVATPGGRFAELPVVTVQLPLYNERYVAERLLDAVAALDWPRDRLEIQVLDDSSDDTVDICARKVAELRARGLDAHHLRRGDRAGFKAGALEHGLHRARGELLLVFDADFLPGPDVLRRAVDHFTDDKVAMVQLRWEHLNRDYSRLTETQALLLDGHFVVEHGARFRAGRFFNFSGTAGIWRKAAILDAGGWQHDTLTEDMDLSYRAQLAGWRFVFVAGAAVPAELPVEMNAFKSQQFRWAKGQMQCARKLLPAVLRAPLPARIKLEAFFHLTNNVAYALLLLVCLLLVPNLTVVHAHSVAEIVILDAPLVFGATLSVAAFYVVSQRELVPGGAGRALVRLPWLMGLCAGLCVSQACAVVEALIGRSSEFVRTPKRGVRRRGERLPATDRGYRGARTLTSVVELGLCAYMLGAIGLAVRAGHWLTMPFLVLFAGGFAYVGALSLWPAKQWPADKNRATEVAPLEQ